MNCSTQPRTISFKAFFRAYLWFLACLPLTLFLFEPILRSSFLSDDFTLLRGLRDGGPFIPWRFSGNPPILFFRPLALLSLHLDQTLWGLHPASFHATSLLLHGFNAFLVSLVFWLLPETPAAGPRSWAASVTAGFLFLIHPSHSEPVAWISGRADLLAAFFGLLALVAYLKFRSGRGPAALVASLVLFFAALLCKESAIALPLILLVWEILALRPDVARPSWRRALAPSAIFFAVLAVYFAVRRFALGSLIGGYGAARHFDPHPLHWLRNVLAQTIRAVCPYLPVHPGDLTSRPVHFLISPDGLLLMTLLILLLLTLPYFFRVKLLGDRVNLALFLGFFISLLPVANLPVSLRGSQGERFIYFPSVFAMLLISRVFLLPTPPARPIGRRMLYFLRPLGLAFLFLPSLYLALFQWQNAGVVAEHILGTLGSLDHVRRVFVLNLPDNLNGAYIFRNGFADAVALFAPLGEEAPEIEVLTLHEIRRPYDEVSARQRADDAFSLRLDDDRAAFLIPLGATGEEIERDHAGIRFPAPNRARIQLRDLGDRDRVYYYTAGGLRIIRDAAPWQPLTPRQLRLIALAGRLSASRMDVPGRNPADRIPARAPDPG